MATQVSSAGKTLAILGGATAILGGILAAFGGQAPRPQMQGPPRMPPRKKNCGRCGR